MKKSLLLFLSIILSFLTFSCEQSLIDSQSDLALIAMLMNGSSSNSSGSDSVKYGSLSVYSGSDSVRALDISSIKGADVTVSGYGISSKSKENVTVSSGSGSVSFDNIPVGNNRVVSVQAKENVENVLSAIAGVKMTAVKNIAAGENSVNVTWDSSAVGNVYSELLSLGYDVTSLSAETVEGYLPKDSENKIIHAALIDAASLAADIQSGTASAAKAETYKLTAGTVTFTSDTSSSAIKVQVCDPVSDVLSSVVSGTNTISNVAPGTWKVYALLGESIVYSNSVTLTNGGTVDLGSVSFKVPSPRLENASGTQISEFITGTTTVYLKARTLDDEEELNGVAIYYTTDGTEPTTSSTRYTSSGISVSVGTTVKAIAVCEGLLDSDVSSWTFAEPSLGYTHPSSGDYSPADEDSWSSGTWELGATVSGGNTTFALYSANATKVLLEIYGSAYGADAIYDYWMVKDSSSVWRAKISGDLSGKIYAFRCWGPNWKYDSAWTRGNSSAGFIADCDEKGNRFNPNKVVYDPYTRELTHDPSNADALADSPTYDASVSGSSYYVLSTGDLYRNYDTGKYAPKGYIISDSTGYGTKPGIAASEARIYEAHVRGLTNHTSSSSLTSILDGIDGFDEVQNVPAEYRGTYKGAAYMAPYLKALGINTIELLPVHETDNDANPDDGPGGNYWGYMTFGYFAPDRRYSYDKTAGGPTREFKQMVEAFHNEGIEVYLDVVYNHSGEGGAWNGSTDENAQCTVLSMRGIDNQTYYSLVSTDKSSYWETTGCGNNLQCDNSVVRQFILDSLSYWITDMGVDGFRFDLAPVLGREGNGTWTFSSSATTLTQIASLGSAYSVEMIAEAWDCQWPGGYKIGKFPSGWGDWNGVYRDVVRKYVGGAGTTETKSDSGNVLYNLNIGNALYGSSDVFGSYRPSVNMIVAHDGFTLADLSSYAGTGNALNSTLSWPFGTSDGGNSDTNYIPVDTQAGHRQINRNYIALQMVTRGIPMIVWGDEFSRTQNGNNNPYNIDSVATWNNYNMINTKSPQAVATGGSGSYTDKFGTFNNTNGVNGNFVFMKRMLEMHSDPAFTQTSYTTPVLTYQDGGDSSDFTFGYKIAGSAVSGGHDFYFFSNMTGGEVSVTIPAPATGTHWVRICDTGSWAEPYMNSWDPYDTDASGYYAITDSKTYGVGAWTVLILEQISDDTTPTCATPSISGTTPFETSTSVTISCSTDGANIYYTTDGSTPGSTNGTLYSGSFSVSATTTVKAIAVLSGYNDSSVASKTFTLKGESVVSDKSGVMLQGFNWDSAPRGYSAKWGKWYATVTNNASAIGNTFAYMWCPPPSMCDTASSEGYCPTQLNVLDNCYGTESELRTMISSISPTKAIADIVINHRSGTTSWGDFTNPDWGCSLSSNNYPAICSDDEGFTTSTSPMYGYSGNGGASDTGEGYSASRDLDHKNTTVQEGIKSWMNDVLKDAGFVGWRYDYVKGYSGYYVGLYDAATSAEFSVGEYWPTDGYSSSSPSTWGNEIKNWVSNTETGGYRSRAFDFALKGAMNTVFGYNASGVSNSNYALLADSSNLYISQPEDAVTFVDNHDTGSTQQHWYLDPNDVGTAYALILTHPGYPCVAWQHYFTYAESGSNGTDSGAQYQAGNTVNGTSNTLRQHIDELIELRKDLGIEYDSTRTTIAAESGYYVALVEGTNGNLLVEIGSGWSKTSSYSDYEEYYSGTNFTIWTDSASSKCKSPVISFVDGTCTITCATDGATIKYSTDGTSYSTYSAPFSVTEGTTVYAKATASGYEDSSVVSKKYTTAVTLHFTNNYGWSSVYAYFFTGTTTVGTGWPGTLLSDSYTNDMSQTVYRVTVPSGATCVIFNDGNGTQTADITLTGEDTGYYISGGSSNAYAVGTWTPSE